MFVNLWHAWYRYGMADGGERRHKYGYYEEMCALAPDYMDNVRQHIALLGIQPGTAEYRDIAEWVALCTRPEHSTLPVDTSTWSDPAYAVIQAVEAYILSSLIPNASEDVVTPEESLAVHYMRQLPDNVSYMLDVYPDEQGINGRAILFRSMKHEHASLAGPHTDRQIVYVAAQPGVITEEDHIIGIGVFPVMACN